MSRIGKLPIIVPNNIRVYIRNSEIDFVYNEVKKTYIISDGLCAIYENQQINLILQNKIGNVASKDMSMKLGMDRSNIKNIVQGLENPFKIILEINGVGYKASVEKSLLNLTLGHSHEIVYAIPKGISIVFEKPNLIVINGEDKVLIGQVASEIISFRSPEPYKGKGIKILGKAIVRKEGKKK